MPATTPGSSGLSNHCTCTLRNPSGSCCDLGRLDHLVRLGPERSDVDEREVGDVEEVVGHEARRSTSVRDGGSQAPTYSASSASGSSNSSVRGGSGASQTTPQRSVSPAGCGVGGQASPVAAQHVRQADHGRLVRLGPISSDSAAGCQAPRSRGSALRSPSGVGGGSAGRSLTQAQSRPSSSLARGAGGQVRPRRDVGLLAERGQQHARPGLVELPAVVGAAQPAAGHARRRQRDQPVRAERGDQAGRRVLGEPHRDERPAGDLDRPRHRRDLG